MALFKYICSYSNFVHAVAGAMGGSTALTIFYPLDLARTRLQVDKLQTAHHAHRLLLNIAAEEGITAWYNGWRPVLTSQIISNLVYFYTYNLLKLALAGDSAESRPIRHLLFAFIAGSVNVVITTPLWVVNTRLRLQGIKLKTAHYHSKQDHYHGIVDAMKKILRKEGIRALWSGTLTSIILASNPAIVFMVYEALKKYAQLVFAKQDLPGLVYFAMGAISKMAATLVTYPIQLIQSQLRAGFVKGMRQQGIVEVVLNKMRSEGLTSLFRGLETKLLQTVLTAATMFLVYEKVAALVFYVMGITAPHHASQ